MICHMSPSLDHGLHSPLGSSTCVQQARAMSLTELLFVMTRLAELLFVMTRLTELLFVITRLTELLFVTRHWLFSHACARD